MENYLIYLSKLTEYTNSFMNNISFKILFSYFYTCIPVFSEIPINKFPFANFVLGDFVENLLHFQNVTLFGILPPMTIYFPTNDAEDMPFHMPTFKHILYIFLYFFTHMLYML